MLRKLNRLICPHVNRRPYFDNHHHEAVASAAATAAKNSNAGMHPITRSRVAGSVFLNIMYVIA
jgi:hypothetical protein